jgi:hypothetical protein
MKGLFHGTKGISDWELLMMNYILSVNWFSGRKRVSLANNSRTGPGTKEYGFHTRRLLVTGII